MRPAPLDLEQILFDAIARELDAADQLLTSTGAVSQLSALATHCQGAASLARAAALLLDKAG